MTPTKQHCLFITVLLFFLNAAVSSVTAQERATYTYASRSEDVVSRIVARKVSRDLGVNLVAVNYSDYSSQLDAVESGEVDFASNITFTKERGERLIFSAPTNIEYVYFFSKRELELEELNTVGVPHGSIYGDYVLEHNPDLKVFKYHSISEAKQLIDDNQVEGIVDSLSMLKFMALAGMDSKLLNHKYPSKPVSLITGKEDNIATLKQIERYMHTPEIQRLLRTTAEAYQFEVKRQALRKHVILSGVDLTEPLKVKIESFNQFGDYTDDGKVEGIAADVVFQACQLMRLECVLTSKADESWQSMYSSLLNGEIDILAPYAITKERKQVAHISDKFYEPEAIVIKRKGYKDNVYRSISELVAERVGVIEGRIFETVLRRRLPHKPFMTFEQPEEQLAALLAKEVDYIVMTRTTYNRLLRDTGTILPIVEDEMIGAFYSYGVGIGFQNNSQGQILSGLFSEAIQLLDVKAIIKKYDYAPDWQTTLTNQKYFTQKSQQLLLLIVIALIVISYFWHKQSITDSLTKLKNRLALYKKYKEGLSKDQVLVYFDINKFKVVNDTYGHRTGDLVLQAVAANINRYWRYDSYRIGGDEFILIGKVSETEVKSCLQKIGFFEFDNGKCLPFEVRISYGCYTSSGNDLSLDDCIHLADIEMYKFKAE